MVMTRRLIGYPFTYALISSRTTWVRLAWTLAYKEKEEGGRPQVKNYEER